MSEPSFLFFRNILLAFHHITRSISYRLSGRQTSGVPAQQSDEASSFKLWVKSACVFQYFHNCGLTDVFGKWV